MTMYRLLRSLEPLIRQEGGQKDMAAQEIAELEERMKVSWLLIGLECH
ncbi:unnamed protein product [Protopolystoma xenopodis]|uniref:Uncharacterized protein n=1 Tax=Protopolystoma xenopodis TaxID=117903 RepID=A0A3S5BTB1_9PLAT|nr:unnamed protein product [Protopolystoma xenopodis]